MKRGIIWIVLLAASGAARAQEQPSASSIASIESLIRSHNYGQAVDAAQTHLKTLPSDYRCWTLEGIALSMQAKNDDALAAYDKALQISPSYLPALKAEAQLLYPRGDRRVIPVLRSIVQADPNDRTAHEMLGVMERHQEKCGAALKEFALAGDAVDSHRESLEAYGYCLVQAKQWQDAAAVFQKLVTLAPDASYARYDLAVAEIASKQNQAAADTLQPLLTPAENDADVLSLGSQAYEALGNTPRAVALLRQAIVLDPANPDYYVLFASLCLDHDSYQVGIDMLNAGLRRLPENASLYLSRGLLYAQLAEYEKAEADFSDAEKRDSKQGLSFYAADLAEMQQNRPDQALAHVRSQLQAHPDNPQLNLLLAKLLINQTPNPGSPSFNKAMHAAQLAIQKKPDLADARDLLASMYMSSGDYDRAIEQSRIALQSAPSDEAATYHLMISLRHKGDKKELPALVKRLADLHQQSLKAETDRKRYRLEESTSQPSQ